MTIDFFKLTPKEQAVLVQQAANELNIADTIIEKDLWICWVLDVLFSMPLKMAFKGGTSLSKVFNAINRFSEDVDITIDYRNFQDALDLSTISGSQLKKFSARIKAQLKETVDAQIVPYIQQQVEETFQNQKFSIEINNESEELHFYYPSVLTQEQGYLREHVLIEFGMQPTLYLSVCRSFIAPLVRLIYAESICYWTKSIN